MYVSWSEGESDSDHEEESAKQVTALTDICESNKETCESDKESYVGELTVS